MNHSMNDTVPPSRAAILLVQLGTADRPEVPEVRRYLREFLSDRRVVEQSPLIWWPILYSVVLTRRPKESAEKYRSIWTKAGSPLLVNTKLVAEALQDELNKRGRQVEVVWASYGHTQKHYDPSRLNQTEGRPERSDSSKSLRWSSLFNSSLTSSSLLTSESPFSISDIRSEFSLFI